MSRRPASCFRGTCLVAFAAAALVGCGAHESNEPVAPPPIAASKPAAPPPAQPSEPQPTQQAAPPPQQAGTQALAQSVGTPPPASTGGTVVEPAHTPGTSLPGAIPPSPAPSPGAQQQALPDPLQAMRDGEARKADYQRRLAEAQAAAQNALTNAETWQRNALAFKNPFLARPQLSPEDSAAIAGMDGAQRVKWSEGKLAEAMAASNAAQKAVDDLKANPPLN